MNNLIGALARKVGMNYRQISILSLLAMTLLSLVGAIDVSADTLAPMPPGNQRVRTRHLADNEYRFASALHIIAVKCVSCHRPGGSASDFTAYMPAESLFVSANLIVPGQPQNSLLYKYLIGSGFSPPPLGTMPLGTSFSTAELNIIRDWITNIGTPTTVPTPLPSEPGPSGSVGLSPAGASPRLGDRFFVKAVLDQVFGPSAAPITAAQIQNLVSIFGGACDPMGAMPPNGQNSDIVCPNVDAQIIGASFIPPPSTSRAGQTIKVCNVLSFNDSALQFAIRAAIQSSDLTYLGAAPVPTQAQIQAAYHLFNPGSPDLPASGVDSLSALANATVDASYPRCAAQNRNCQLDPWRYVILALCGDPEWQEQ